MEIGEKQVKHGWVNNVRDLLSSSLHRYLEQVIYTENREDNNAATLIQLNNWKDAPPGVGSSYGPCPSIFSRHLENSAAPLRAII
ncbi:MAG: hypothetical protein PHG00_15555 [Methylococcales bacterium]|nr:hypothetical protein [Methylococcales bacterium]